MNGSQVIPWPVYNSLADDRTRSIRYYVELSIDGVLP